MGAVDMDVELAAVYSVETINRTRVATLPCVNSDRERKALFHVVGCGCVVYENKKCMLLF